MMRHRPHPSAAPSPRGGALVLGATGAVGRRIARRLAAAGYAVIVQHARQRGAARDLVGAIAREGGVACAVEADAVGEGGLARAFAAGARRGARVGLVVVCPEPAVAERERIPFDHYFGNAAHRVVDVLRGAATRLPSGGQVIVVQERGDAGAYLDAADALQRVVQAFAAPLADAGIALHAIAPGPAAAGYDADAVLRHVLRQVDAASRPPAEADRRRIATPCCGAHP